MVGTILFTLVFQQTDLHFPARESVVQHTAYTPTVMPDVPIVRVNGPITPYSTPATPVVVTPVAAAPSVTPTAAPGPVVVASSDPVATETPVGPGKLSDAQIVQVAAVAGWDPSLVPQLLIIVHCESGGNSFADNSDKYFGLLQLSPLWFNYAGEDATNWADPLVNLRAGRATVNYDIAHGYAPWAQWECKKDL